MLLAPKPGAYPREYGATGKTINLPSRMPKNQAVLDALFGRNKGSNSQSMMSNLARTRVTTASSTMNKMIPISNKYEFFHKFIITTFLQTDFLIGAYCLFAYDLFHALYLCHFQISFLRCPYPSFCRIASEMLRGLSLLHLSLYFLNKHTQYKVLTVLETF